MSLSTYIFQFTQSIGLLFCFCTLQQSIFHSLNEPMNQNSELRDIQNHLRQQSLVRMTDYIHPELQMPHQPINPRECDELHEELTHKIKDKVEKLQREEIKGTVQGDYQKQYMEFAMGVQNNESIMGHICKDFKSMHEMADILLNPPPLGGNTLYLSTKNPPNPSEEQQFQQMFKKYEEKFKSGDKMDNSEAQQAIRRAKNYLFQKKS